MAYSLKDLCIQIQPHLAWELDVSAIHNRCDKLASSNIEIECFTVVEDAEDVAYINLMFTTKALEALWEILQAQLYGDEYLGPLLLKSSIATCQGIHGWDDYLLLHHFDPTVRLDRPAHD